MRRYPQHARPLALLALLGIVVSLILASQPATAAPPETLVPFGATWAYYDVADDSGPPTDGAGRDWTDPLYDVSAWPGSGPAQLGYGDGDEATTVDYGGNPLNKHVATYFRHSFSVANPAEHVRLWLELVRDDGVVVYLNGVEVHRDNMPSGTIGFETFAVGAMSGTGEDYPFGVNVDPAGLLTAGQNVLAVSIHQVTRTSSDVSFDLRLRSLEPIESMAVPHNVIIMIGDGMGPEHVRAGGMYANGAAGTLVMESMPYHGSMSTFSANADITDSAASATAMATAFKVNNGVISMAIPGDSSELETTLEFFAARCKRTGLVTSTYLTHATPAAFGAHEESRNNNSAIALDYLAQTRPNVLLGGGGNGLSVEAAESAGYTVVTDRAGLDGLDLGIEDFVIGLFGDTHMPFEYDYEIGASQAYDTLPHLSELITPTLSILSQDPDGFFLMVEGGRIDHAGHINDINRNVRETAEFDRAVALVLDWVQSHPNTLLIVTADHETGGMEIVNDNGVGNAPSVTWSTLSHTSVPVPIYGWGTNADLIPHVVDNSDIKVLARAGQDEEAPPHCAVPVAISLDEIRMPATQVPRPIWIIGAALILLTLAVEFSAGRTRKR